MLLSLVPSANQTGHEARWFPVRVASHTAWIHLKLLFHRMNCYHFLLTCTPLIMHSNKCVHVENIYEEALGRRSQTDITKLDKNHLINQLSKKFCAHSNLDTKSVLFLRHAFS